MTKCLTLFKVLNGLVGKELSIKLKNLEKKILTIKSHIERMFNGEDFIFKMA